MLGAGVAIHAAAPRSSRVLQPWSSDGSFIVGGLVPGRAWLLVERPGYVRQAVEVQVPLGARLDVGTILLQRGGELAGHILDPDGNPVEARAVAFTVDTEGRPCFVGSGPDASPDPRTGAYYILDLPLTDVYVALADERFAANAVAVHVGSQAGKTELDLIARTGPRVTFRLKDTTFAATLVTVRDPQGVPLFSAAVGQAAPVVVRLLPGTYDIVIEQPAGGPSARRLVVGADDVEFGIEPAF